MLSQPAAVCAHLIVGEMALPWVSEEDGTKKNPYYNDIIADGEFDLYSELAAKKAKANYYANITFIDEQVGKILDSLEECGLEEDTLIIFTSDHGDLMGDHGLWYKKVGYEGSIHVPMILRWKNHLPGGLRCNTVTSLLDIYPTLLEVAGVSVESTLPGKNLMDIISDEVNNKEVSREICVSEYGFPPNHMLHVRSKSFKYLYHQNGGYEELYNLEEDPCELVDLSNDENYREILQRLKAQMIEWIKAYSNPKYALNEKDELTVVNIDATVRNNPKPFSRMPWDLRIPPVLLDEEDKGWFWERVEGDWSTVFEKIVN